MPVGLKASGPEWGKEDQEPVPAGRITFFFKQSAAFRTEIGTTLDGKQYREYPVPRPIG